MSFRRPRLRVRGIRMPLHVPRARKGRECFRPLRPADLRSRWIEPDDPFRRGGRVPSPRRRVGAFGIHEGRRRGQGLRVGHGRRGRADLSFAARAIRRSVRALFPVFLSGGSPTGDRPLTRWTSGRPCRGDGGDPEPSYADPGRARPGPPSSAPPAVLLRDASGGCDPKRGRQAALGRVSRGRGHPAPDRRVCVRIAPRAIRSGKPGSAATAP